MIGEITTSFFVIFTLLVFVVNLILVLRSFWIYKKDKPQRTFKKGTSPKVTILVPAYNEQVNILNSVESMLKQDYENFDVVIINDGSTDDTANKIRKHFKLKKINKEELRQSSINNHKKILGVYKKDNIILVDKENGERVMPLMLVSHSQTLNGSWVWMGILYLNLMPLLLICLLERKK